MLLWQGVFAQEPLNVLHLTFHRGCAREIEEVADALGFDVETWFIPDLPPLFLDGVSRGNALYNIGHDRAERIWELHKSTFEEFDAIITSDTAPLARIFLQNGYTKPLIIWICNRFDYADQESLDCDFPDPEFYRLFDKAYERKNVKVVAYTRFEHEYAREKGVDTGNLVITPCHPSPFSFDSSIPNSVNKEETFFLPPYVNEELFLSQCTDLGIPVYRGRYHGSSDLHRFKAIIHFPYACSNLAFFENISEGIPYLVPSVHLLKKLLREGSYWFANQEYFLKQERFDLTEWYQPGREKVITYFDSWEDLQEKINTIDFSSLRDGVKKYAEEYREMMMDRWSKVWLEL